MKSEQHFCSKCGDRIFREGFQIDDKLYCRNCLIENFRVKYDDREYAYVEGANNIVSEVKQEDHEVSD